MEFYERIDARGVRETGRPVSFVPKGALIHHPEGAVVFPAEIVCSAMRMWLLREPYGQCHISADLLSLSTQSAVCFAKVAKQGTEQKRSAPTPPARTNLPPAALLRLWVSLQTIPIFFLRKRNKNQERKDGENEWRFTIWKQRLSAEVWGVLLWQLPPI